MLWRGEFGRLPISQGGTGRDHNRHAFSLFLSCGGFRGGYVHGATDEFGYRSVKDRTSCPDLLATILHQLGIDHDRLTFLHHGREETLTDSPVSGAHIVKELLRWGVAILHFADKAILIPLQHRQISVRSIGVPSMPRQIVFLVLAISFLSSFAKAENWNNWRGPTGNGSSSTAKPPIEWNTTKNVKWKVAIPGRGISTPIVWEDRIFVSGAHPVGEKPAQGPPNLEFKVYCFDRATGKLIWDKTATIATPHQKTHDTNSFSSASPCTDGQHVYAHFGSRGLYCYTMDGDFKWKRDDFGRMDILNGFGEGSSPTLIGNMILVPWDHQGPSALYALDKLTGKQIWKEDRDEPTGWCTPLIVEHDGKKQIIMNGANFARSYDLETGKEIWKCSGQTKRPVASPVAANGLVYIGSGFQGAFMGAFRLDGKGDIKGTDKVVWTLNQDCPDIASPMYSNGRIYFHKGKSGLLSCVDAATGKPHFMIQRLPGVEQTYSSPIAAGGHVYLTGRTGTTVVIKEQDNLEIVASNDLNETVSATPVPVDNELFIRGEDHLYCISTQPKQVSANVQK